MIVARRQAHRELGEWKEVSTQTQIEKWRPRREKPKVGEVPIPKPVIENCGSNGIDRNGEDVGSEGREC